MNGLKYEYIAGYYIDISEMYSHTRPLKEVDQVTYKVMIYMGVPERHV